MVAFRMNMLVCAGETSLWYCNVLSLLTLLFMTYSVVTTDTESGNSYYFGYSPVLYNATGKVYILDFMYCYLEEAECMF